MTQKHVYYLCIYYWPGWPSPTDSEVKRKEQSDNSWYLILEPLVLLDEADGDEWPFSLTVSGILEDRDNQTDQQEQEQQDQQDQTRSRFKEKRTGNTARLFIYHYHHSPLAPLLLAASPHCSHAIGSRDSPLPETKPANYKSIKHFKRLRLNLAILCTKRAIYTFKINI